MKTFVTLFERTANEHLLKDVGMIPYFINKHDDFQASIATCKMSGDYYYLNDYLENFKVEFIPYRFNNIWISGILYLFKNSKKIDVLNLYHLKFKTFIDYLVYKTVNKKGKVYLKLDIGYKAIIKRDGFIKVALYKFFLKHVDYCSAESTFMVNEIEKKYGVKVSYLSNGFFNFENSEKRKKIDKENIFLTVGRLGTEEKATELLLNAFAQSLNEHNWKLVLVGPIKEGFDTYIENFYKNNPELKLRVIFTGPIYNKKELQEYYNRAKVFVLPSKWESFGLVLLEALSCGCYLLGSDRIPALRDLIENGKYGQYFEFGSSEKLSNALVDVSKREYNNSQVLNEILYADNNFRWDKLVDKLVVELKKEI